nr:MAG TPA: hypothetical protein [Caudoviricetes sp.]
MHYEHRYFNSCTKRDGNACRVRRMGRYLSWLCLPEK